MLLHGKETARLRFRNITEEDYDAWLEFISNPVATKYFNKTDTPEIMCREWIDRCLMRYETQGYGMYALTEKNTNEFIGQCGILIQEAEGKTYMELGYHLFPKHWKKGYATEAATFCRDFAFENNMDMDGKIISLIHPENLDSQAVAKRNGMKFERTVRWRDVLHCAFVITRKEWEQLKKTNLHRDASR